MDVQWKRGNFIKFHARMKVRIGQNSQGIMQIEKGDELEFDGTMMKYAGTETNLPSLRGAVKADWLVGLDSPEISGDSLPVSAQPQRKMAKAQTVNKDLLSVQRHEARAIETGGTDEETVLQVSDRQGSPEIDGGARPEPNRLVNPRTASADQGEKTVDIKLRTASDSGSTDVSTSSYSQTLKESELQKVGGRQASFAKTEIKEGITIKSNLGDIRGVTSGDEEDAKIVGRVRKATKVGTEGIEVEDTSQSALEATGGVESEIKVSAIEPQSEPEIETPNIDVKAPKKIKTSGKIPTRIRIAQYIKPDFPNSWDFSGKMKDRMKRLKDFGTDPVTLEAIYAAEGDNFRRALEKEFPKQFASA